MKQHRFNTLIAAAVALTAVLWLAPATRATLPVTSGLVLQLDASNSANFTLNNVNHVGTWQDLSPDGNTVAQPDGSGTYSPILVPGAINGLGAVRWDGNDSLYRGIYATPATSGLPTGNGNFTVFAVFTTIQPPGTYRYVLDFGAGGAGATAVQLIAPPGDEPAGDMLDGYINAGVKPGLSATHPVENGAAHIGAQTFDNSLGSANLKTFVDGFAGATSSFTAGNLPSSGGVISVGARIDESAEYFIGDIGEVLVYNRALTSTELNSVGYYLQSKWGVSGSYLADSVPEPSTLLLVACGGLLVWKRWG